MDKASADRAFPVHARDRSTLRSGLIWPAPSSRPGSLGCVPAINPVSGSVLPQTTEAREG